MLSRIIPAITLVCVLTGAAWAPLSSAPQAAPDDLLARAGGQELSVARMAMLLGGSLVPATPENVATTVDLWVSYHLLAQAGARGDDLVNDDAMADDAMWYDLLKLRVAAYYEQVKRGFPAPDPARVAAEYASGRMLAAQHILFAFPPGEVSQRARDSIRARAAAVLARVTSENFADMAREYSQDPGAAGTDGSLGVFPLAPAAGAMVAEFEAAVRALRPGEITRQLVQTQFGFHIIRRHTLADVRDVFETHLRALEEAEHRDAYLARKRADYALRFTPDAPQRIRAVASSKAPAVFERDTTTVATSRIGAFTTARLVAWLEAVSAERTLSASLAAADDSTALRLVGALIEQEILDDEARRAGVRPDTADLRQLRSGFATMTRLAAITLFVEDQALRDSAATREERERVAARAVERALDQIFSTGGKGYATVPPHLGGALRRRYSPQVNAAMFPRAAERAAAVRAALDSMAAVPRARDR